MGIGTTNPAYKLAVNGNIGAKDIIVTNSGWSDYVFRPGYRLRPLSEVSRFIQANGHLPDIPTEGEVKEKGVSVGDMQAKLLAKVEELTLHLIEEQRPCTGAEVCLSPAGNGVHPAVDPRVKQRDTTLADTGQTSKQVDTFDPFNNVTQHDEYGFDNRIARRTTTSFVTVNPVNGIDYTTVGMDFAFRLVEGTEYQTARTAANQAIRQADPAAYAGKEIHEISPVKFGGSPTSPANKVALPTDVHRQQVTPWWNRLKKDLENLVGGGPN